MLLSDQMYAECKYYLSWRLNEDLGYRHWHTSYKYSWPVVTWTWNKSLCSLSCLQKTWRLRFFYAPRPFIFCLFFNTYCTDNFSDYAEMYSPGCFCNAGEKARLRLPDKVCWRTARSCTVVHQHLPARFEGCWIRLLVSLKLNSKIKYIKLQTMFTKLIILKVLEHSVAWENAWNSIQYYYDTVSLVTRRLLACFMDWKPDLNVSNVEKIEHRSNC